MANIDTEIAEIEGASTGEEVRQSLVDGLNAVNNGTLPAVSQSDAGKFMMVNNSGQWSVGSGGLVPTPTGTKSITQNGTHDVTSYASADVNVPNSYSASDEGKVVDDGALVSQTSRNVTQNGTYDTTTNDEVVVNVQGGGGGGVIEPLSVTQNGTYTPPSGVDGYAPVTVNVSGGGGVDLVRHDYIQFDGASNHFITTPYSVNADYEVTIVFDAISNRNNQAVIGVAGGGMYNRLLQFNNLWYGGTGGQSQGTFSKPITGKHTYVTNRNGKCYFDDEEVLNFSPISAGSNGMLIGYSNEGTVFDGKVYEYKIKSVSTGETVFHGFPYNVEINGSVLATILRDSERNINIQATGLQAYDDE